MQAQLTAVADDDLEGKAILLHALAETAPAVAGAPAPAEWAQELCGAVEEGARLLEENRLAPANGQAKAALLEALIRASEPSAEFLDEAEMAARAQRLLDHFDRAL